jgi:LEA14-like dessication related protein
MKKEILIIFMIIIITFLSISFIFVNFNSDLGAINNINVKLIDMEVFDANIASFKLKLIVEIINPSDRDIIDLSTDFRIYIEDNYIGEGNFSKVNIPKYSNLSKDVIVKIYYSGLADAVVDLIKDIINEEEFNLEIKGTLYAKALFGWSIIEQSYIATKTYQ